MKTEPLRHETWECVLTLSERVRRDGIDSRAKLEPLLEFIERVGFMPHAYDVNQHGSWREYDREKCVVDGLNQRVQVIQVRGGGEALGLVVTSGQACMMRWVGSAESVGEVAQRVAADLQGHAEQMGVARWSVRSSTWAGSEVLGQVEGGYGAYDWVDDGRWAVKKMGEVWWVMIGVNRLKSQMDNEVLRHQEEVLGGGG